MFYKINLILFLILVNSACLFAQEQLFQDPFTESEQEDSISQESEQKNVTVSYANFRDDFSRFCFYLVSDGKQPEWNSAIDKARAVNDRCKACRSLYKSLSCKGKDMQANKKVSMPATELLAVTSEIFRTIAQNNDLKNQTTLALDPVLEDLKQIKETSSGQYFQILAEYIKTPLADVFRSNQEKIKGTKREEQKKQLDSLF